MVKGKVGRRPLKAVSTGTWTFNVVDEETGEVHLRNVSMQSADDYMDNAHDGTNTKFSQYTEPGGENYKELLLTMPEKQPTLTQVEINKQMKSEFSGYEGTFEDLSKVQQDYIIEQALLRQKDYSKINPKNAFRSSHYDEPNILAHVRFNERTGENGERVLFVEEIQSDWAQKGKKEGFKSDSRKVIAESLRKEKDNFYAKLNQSEDEQVEYGLSQFESGKITREQLDKILLANGYSEYDLKSAAETNSVPDMPFKKT